MISAGFPSANSYKESIHVSLVYDICKYVEDEDGMTPLEMARKKSYTRRTEVAQLL